jgi:predicted transcriptional regulator
VISASQIRAGRGLVNLTVKALADRAGVGVHVIQRLEHEKVDVGNANAKTIAAITRALDEAGVVFLSDGYGVTLADYAVAAVEAKKQAEAKKAEAGKGTIKRSKR